MTVRTKRYELKAGDTRQVKMIQIDKPIRFQIEGAASFTYQLKINELSIGSAAAVVSGVLAPVGGAWGSEIEIVCVTEGILHIAYMG